MGAPTVAIDGHAVPRDGVYERHRPEQSLLYQVVAAHYPRLLERRMVESAALLVDEVLPDVPIRQWVLSVPYPLRFLFAHNPTAMGQALRIAYRVIAGFLIHKAGLRQRRAQCGAVTLIQRFGSALNLNVHFHMLIPDGVYRLEHAQPVFRRVSRPTAPELEALVRRISEGIGRHLERHGLLVRDAESSHLALDPDNESDALADLQGHSISYRIALGRHKGRKAFTLQTLPPRGEDQGADRAAQASGFSLHAGVAAEAEQRPKLERLCRYITRPAVAIERLSLTAQGNVRYALKTPYRDGTTQVMFEPLDFLARLAALVPSPGVNLTRYHGVFAPNHRLRAQIVPAARGSRQPAAPGTVTPHVAMSWRSV